MESEGIISNPVTQDILTKGHQSIRIAADGFSILVSDASYKPVFLHHQKLGASVSPQVYSLECRRILRENGLEAFEGESTLVLDRSPVITVPAEFFREDQCQAMLGRATRLSEENQVLNRYVENRKLHFIYSLPRELDSLVSGINGRTELLHAQEALLSLADQVQASDHQRGFVLTEIQEQTMHILVIREDELLLLNSYELKMPEDFIYHSLNTMKQLDLDRTKVPVYLAGIVHTEHELYGLLGKYIRNTKSTPYYLEELDRSQMLRFMLLSEASKCA